jgi:hypothetical protein
MRCPLAAPVVELASVALGFVLTRRPVRLGQPDLNDYGERADYRSPAVAPLLFARTHNPLYSLARIEDSVNRLTLCAAEPNPRLNV